MKKNMIIVGAGLAGLSAALQAVKEGCSVKLISSLPSERAQSVMAEGGINAALNTKGEDDSTQEHYEDTIKAGCNLADPNAVWNMTQAAPEVVKWLHSIGVQFNTCGYDELDLRNFGGQKKKRTAFAKSDTGKQIMTAMIDAVRRLEVQGQIERFEHHSFRTLLMTANICHGCVVCDNYTGEIKMLYADAVIVASGGMHGLFGNTTGSLANTGEVSASLFSAGVPMANLEMIQYHPTTVEIGGKKMLISEAARGEGGRLFTYRVKQSVQSFCLIARELAHSLSSSACGGRKQNSFAVCFHYFYYSIEGCRFSCTGTARQNEHTLGKCHSDCFLLQIGIFDSVLFFTFFNRLVNVFNFL